MFTINRSAGRGRNALCRRRQVFGRLDDLIRGFLGRTRRLSGPAFAGEMLPEEQRAHCEQEEQRSGRRRWDMGTGGGTTGHRRTGA